jgi:hypothetical protein
MQKRIAIYGDSWACGEWDNDALKTKTHTGTPTNYIAKYLAEKKFDVSTYGIPGGSNMATYQKIISPLTGIDNFDIGIVIVTEPFRDFRMSHINYNKQKSFNSNCEFIIKSFLTFLEKYKHKIILVNGLYELEKQKGFLEHLSWCKTLVPNADWPRWYAYGPNIKNFIDQIDKNSVLYDIDENIQKQELFYNNLIQYREYFFPDGIHPNKKAQQILVQKILEILDV